MREAIKGAALGKALRQSSAPPKGCDGDSAKIKATQILTDASGDISPRMKWPFAERQDSPSTGMDQSEWRIILEQILIMGLIVKEEVVSENGDKYILCWIFLSWTDALPSSELVCCVCWDMFSQHERERESTREQMARLPLPKPLGSIYRGWRWMFTFYSIGGVRYYKYVLKFLQQGPQNLLLSPYTSNWASFIQEWRFLAHNFYGNSPTLAPQLFDLDQHDKT
jgi:hypothetical protein